jgi:protein SCO1/2
MRSFLLVLLLIVSAPPARAHHDAGTAAASAPAVQAVSPDGGARARAARLFFSDRELVTHRGDEVAFYRDVLRDNVVVINFVFTRCADSCPTQTARLAETQALLGDAVGHGVALVSISVDPEHDTPRALRQYAERFDAGPGWVFLTGTKEAIDDVLRRLGQLTATPAAHTTLFVLGNVRTGHWLKVHPDAAPADIAAYVRALLAESAGSTHRPNDDGTGSARAASVRRR